MYVGKAQVLLRTLLVAGGDGEGDGDGDGPGGAGFVKYQIPTAAMMTTTMIAIVWT